LVAGRARAALAFAVFVGVLRGRLGGTGLGHALAEFVGDVVWPVLIPDARYAVRAVLLRQLQQMVLDGKRAGVEVTQQRLSIICHSMGCFHTFEALHAAARSTRLGLAPGTDGVRFENVIFMASPVQLIRTVSRLIGPLVPRASGIYAVSLGALRMPDEQVITGEVVRSVKRTVSIVGDMDPVGGYLLGKRLDWAYMDLTVRPQATGHRPQGEVLQLVDEQDLINLEEDDIASVFRDALRPHGAPQIMGQSPHDWGAYIARHAVALQRWLGVSAAAGVEEAA